MVAFEAIIGNPVEIRCGPAAVIGDETSVCHFFVIKREGKARVVG